MYRLYPTDDFDTIIRIYSPEEGGRKTPPMNGIRWDFCYADDDPAAGLWCIYPDFYRADGDSRPPDVPLPVDAEVSARMFIVDEVQRVQVHRQRIKPGVWFYCHEGSRRVAEGEVTRITGLFDARTDPRKPSPKIGSAGPIGDSAESNAQTTPDERDRQDPYWRFRRLTYAGLSIGWILTSLSRLPIGVKPFVLVIALLAAPVLIYLQLAERRAVKIRILQYRGLPGHCVHCGHFQKDKNRQRCICCLKFLDAQPKSD